MRLKDRVALVTGGSSGIGAEVCLQLAAEGAYVGVVASSDINKAQMVAEKIEVAGGRAAAFVGNVAEHKSVAKLVEKALTVLGDIDILINAAGVYYNTPIGGTDEKLINHLIDEAKKLKIKKLSLETGAGIFFNPARKLFNQCGFKICEPFHIVN